MLNNLKTGTAFAIALLSIAPWLMSPDASRADEAAAQAAATADSGHGSSSAAGVRASVAAGMRLPQLAESPGEVPIGTEFPPDVLQRLKEQQAMQAPATTESPVLLKDGAASPAGNAPASNAPAPVSNFAGIPYTGWIPPDPHMAAGPSDLLVAVNSTFRIYNKSGGQIFNSTLLSWFSNVLPSNTSGINVFDPWVLYDQLSGRFIMLALAKRDSDKYSRFLIAVSDNNTAAGNWCLFSLDAKVNGSKNTNNWADYTKVGVTTNAVVLSANMFAFGGGFQYTKMRFISKAKLYASNCPGLPWWDFWNLRNADNSAAFTIQPAHSYVGSTTGYGLNSYSGGGNKLTLWRYITPNNINPNSPTLTRQTTLLPSAYSLAPNAVQKGSATAINTGDARLLNLIYRGNGLWSAHTVGCNWTGDTATRSCIRWYQINPGAGTILQQRSFGASGFHYYYPAIVANNAGTRGNAVIVFNRSGPSEYAGIRYTGRRTGDAVNTLQGSAQLRAGQGCYVRTDSIGRNRWGDYNGAAVDPANANRTWIFSEYASGTSATCGNNVWGTHVGQTTW